MQLNKYLTPISTLEIGENNSTVNKWKQFRSGIGITLMWGHLLSIKTYYLYVLVFLIYHWLSAFNKRCSSLLTFFEMQAQYVTPECRIIWLPFIYFSCKLWSLLQNYHLSWPSQQTSQGYLDQYLLHCNHRSYSFHL